MLGGGVDASNAHHFKDESPLLGGLGGTKPVVTVSGPGSQSKRLTGVGIAAGHAAMEDADGITSVGETGEVNDGSITTEADSQRNAWPRRTRARGIPVGIMALQGIDSSMPGQPFRSHRTIIERSGAKGSKG